MVAFMRSWLKTALLNLVNHNGLESRAKLLMIHFFMHKKKLYAAGSQTAMAMPLSVGPSQQKDKATGLKNLIGSILTTGKN
jgi:hypothetical protein